MKKIICICLSSGCGKLPNHGSPVNTVVDEKEIEVVLMPPLASKTALEPSNTPVSTPEQSKSAPPLSDSVASSSLISWYEYALMIINNSIIKYAVNIGFYALAIACVCYGGYRSLYRFASSEFISVGDLETVNFSAFKL